MAFCVSIIDHSSASMVKLDQKKRISISRLDKIFKVFYALSIHYDLILFLFVLNLIFDLCLFQSVEIVPLYGDMQIQPFSFVKRSPYYDASKWHLCHHESKNTFTIHYQSV